MAFGRCAAALKTASRANPAVHLPYRPRARATPRRPSRNVRRYDWIASSGSVVANDPVNKTDPTGNDSYLVSRPTGYLGNDHMFVIVVDKLGDKPTAIFSFGPTGTPAQSIVGDSKLVSLSGTNTPTAIGDRQAAAALGSPQRAAMAGVSATRINAADSTVTAAGQAVSGALGTLKSPGGVTYGAYPSITGGANSNSAAYAVANSAVTSEGGRSGSQSLPPGAGVPGAAQSGRVENVVPKGPCGKVVCKD
jgi:hypothetical protein